MMESYSSREQFKSNKAQDALSHLRLKPFKKHARFFAPDNDAFHSRTRMLNLRDICRTPITSNSRLGLGELFIIHPKHPLDLIDLDQLEQLTHPCQGVPLEHLPLVES